MIRLTRRRAGAIAVTCALAAGGVVVAAGSGYPADRVRLHGASAWLASPQQGIVTLIDGATDEVAGLVRVDGGKKATDLRVVQSGSSAYVLDPATSAVSRIDGALQTVTPPAVFGESGGGSALSLFADATRVYLVDGVRRVATVADGSTLNVLDRLSLAAQPGTGQSVVDDEGRLWVLDHERGGLTWLEDGKHSRPEIGGADSQLLLVRGRPILVDRARQRLGALGSDGDVGDWSCLDVRAGDKVQLTGSAFTDRVFAVVGASGTLVSSTVGRECDMSVNVGKPGDEFGVPAEVPGYVFVPDRTTGHTIVVDLAARRAVADFDLIQPGHRLELVAKDGYVFYNDLDSEQAGTIRLAGGRWIAGKPVKKYDAALSGTDPKADPSTQPGTQPGTQTGVQPSTPPSTKPAPKPTPKPTKTPPKPVTPTGPPIIRDITFAPNPVVRWFPVTFTGVVENAQQATWAWTLRGEDGAVVHTDSTPGSFTVTPSAGHGTEFTISLTLTGPGGTAGPVVRNVQSTSEIHPAITALTINHSTPGVEQPVKVTGTEQVAGARGVWTWRVTNRDTGAGVLGPVTGPAQTPLDLTFPAVGRYRVSLSVDFDGATSNRNLDVTVTDQCALTRTTSQRVDLRRPSVPRTVGVRLTTCWVPQTVTVTSASWAQVSASTFELAPGATGTVTVQAVGTPGTDGVDPNALSFQLPIDGGIGFDLLGNRAPVWNNYAVCIANPGKVVFYADFDDATPSSLKVTLKVGTFTGTMEYVNGGPSGHGEFFWLEVPETDVPDVQSWTVQATDAYGLRSGVGTASRGSCW